jgi:SMODS and SLOG-associating 2TM effector domain 2
VVVKQISRTTWGRYIILPLKMQKKNIKWYTLAAVPNKRNGRAFRFLAILFVAVAGIVPLVITALPDGVISSKLVDISYIFIGIAAFLIGVDKFFGYSSSWMRYITTQMALETLLAKFRYDWAIESVKAGDKLDADACKPLLIIVKNFAADVQSKMENETAQWATELRNNLTDAEKKAAASTSKVENMPPIITNLTSTPSSPQPAGTDITWTAEANDPENDAISYRFFLNDVEVTDWQLDNHWHWIIPADKAGSSNKIEVRVIDGNHAGKDGFDDQKSENFKVNA